MRHGRASTGGSDRWLLRDVTRTLFLQDRTEAVRIAETDWHSVLNPAILNVLMVVPERMSVGDLYTYIGHLRENGQATSRHEIAFYSKLVYPLAVIVMMILALPFAYIRIRDGVHQREDLSRDRAGPGIPSGLTAVRPSGPAERLAAVVQRLLSDGAFLYRGVGDAVASGEALTGGRWLR